MKRALLVLLLLPFGFACAQGSKPHSLRDVLLEQLRTTHNKEDWFVPVNIALQGLTPEQAAWKPGSGDHSVGQLANHLLFWDSDQLAKFKGEPQPKFSGNNDETFNNFDAKNWAATVQKLDQVLTEWETLVAQADDAKLKSWASTIAHIGAHNAYHIGQIIYIRKLQGSWNPKNGVK